jgi:hypothetical protein
MKRIVLALGLLIGTIVSACAACVGPAVMHDFPATSFNMSMATVPDGNCGSNVAVPTWAGGTLGAMANYGTSPGAVLVPGVNAFVTNTPPVSQSGTWTVQPGNTANTTPWLASISQGGNTAVVKAGNTAAAADLAVVVSDPTLQAIANAPTPAGTNLIGKVGIDQTTPGTTNGVQVNAALPAGTNTIGNFGFDPSSGKGTPASTFLALPATTTTQIVALSGSTKTYVTSYRVLAGGTVNVTFKTGTGSNCGTGTATLEGPWPLTAQAGMTVGSGTGPVLIAGAGLALCITTDASVTGGVALSYQQF